MSTICKIKYLVIGFLSSFERLFPSKLQMALFRWNVQTDFDFLRTMSVGDGVQWCQKQGGPLWFSELYVDAAHKGINTVAEGKALWDAMKRAAEERATFSAA